MDKLLKRQLDIIYKEKNPLSNYAFSLYLFIDGLYHQCCKDGVRDLYFLSREGQFLQMLFEEYLQNNNLDFKPRVHYLYVSRKAIILATLNDLSVENFNAFKMYRGINIEEFLKVLDFSDKEIQMVISSVDVDKRKRHENIIESMDFLHLKKSLLFQEIYEFKRKKANKNAKKYFCDNSFTQATSIAVVDVGWSGTIQDHLEKLGLTKKIYGYYIGVNDNDNPRKKGVLFNKKTNFNTFACYNYNFEYVCVADHGSVEKYDDFGRPVFKEDNDCKLYNEVYCDIRKSIITKFNQIHKSMQLYIDNDMFADYVANKHARMLLCFSDVERKIINKSIYNHPDNFISIKPSKTIKYNLVIIFIKLFLFSQAVTNKTIKLIKFTD